MKEFMTVLYPISQIIIFFFYIPHIKAVLESKSAEAISVPSQFAFFTIGGIAAIYMWVVNADWLVTLIVCGHITVGNLSVALIAWYKQRKYREQRKKASEGPGKGQKEKP